MKKHQIPLVKHRFYSQKWLPRDPPWEGPKFAPAFWKNNGIEDWAPFSPKGGQKTKTEKETKNEKTFLKKVSLTTVTHFRPPQGGLLEKRVPEL